MDRERALRSEIDALRHLPPSIIQVDKKVCISKLFNFCFSDLVSSLFFAVFYKKYACFLTGFILYLFTFHVLFIPQIFLCKKCCSSYGDGCCTSVNHVDSVCISIPGGSGCSIDINGGSGSRIVAVVFGMLAIFLMFMVVAVYICKSDFSLEDSGYRSLHICINFCK